MKKPYLAIAACILACIGLTLWMTLDAGSACNHMHGSFTRNPHGSGPEMEKINAVSCLTKADYVPASDHVGKAFKINSIEKDKNTKGYQAENLQQESLTYQRNVVLSASGCDCRRIVIGGRPQWRCRNSGRPCTP